jgi:hypothetical protein
MSGLWRYEFGYPHMLGDKLWWGTHMWEQVDRLFDALRCALHRVPDEKRQHYLSALDDPHRHQQTLVEMVPAIKIDNDIPMEFEVCGLGNGNRTVDWVILPSDGRKILLDVKRRTKDALIQFENIGEAPEAPEPHHEPAILFKSVEHKFVANDPVYILQGAWIVTDIAQNNARLRAAFAALDEAKVHFVVLGDWQADALLLTRRGEDSAYLHSLFRTVDSSRFSFTGQGHSRDGGAREGSEVGQ